MNRLTSIKMSPYSTVEELKAVAASQIGKTKEDIKTFNIVKKSIDARHKNDIKIIYTVDVSCNVESIEPIRFNKAKSVSKDTIAIIGMGPAGLFAGLLLAKAGYEPHIYERGSDVDNRKIEIDSFINGGDFNPLTNIQFGEGGAGAFSDGKLNTLVKSPYKEMILRIFVECGAPEEILYLNKPHIGTDNLIDVLKSMREMIKNSGGHIHFNSKVQELIIEQGKIKGIVVEDRIIDYDKVVLAIGHSARDTFKMLYDKGVLMEQKPFACGFRIEHLQSMINKSQYGKFADVLGPADYKMVSHTPSGNAIYTFCMCPGGWVIPATSDDGHVVTNGMSEYNRNATNSNSALLINVDKEDFNSEHPLAGIEYQKSLEIKAFEWGGSNYNAPVQLVGDFLKGDLSLSFKSVKASYRPGTEFSPLHLFFNQKITDSIRYAIKDMARFLNGFDDNDAVLTAVESRSSSPVRVVRGSDYQSIGTQGLFPVGEGCGYAGGIMSSSIDGAKVADYIISNI